MGDMFHGLGYATAIFGKWHLGSELQSLATMSQQWLATGMGIVLGPPIQERISQRLD